MGRRWPNTAARFWAKVDKSGDCWLWIAARNGYGYGSFATGDGTQTILAHRWAYIAEYGAIPKGMDVCHHCDTPACVRPAHLFAGDNSAKQLDSAAKGRHWTKRNPSMLAGDRNGSRTHPERLRRGDDNPARQHPEQFQGIRNGGAKLTEEQVVEIRAMLDAGAQGKTIALQFSVSRATISLIRNRKHWAHI